MVVSWRLVLRWLVPVTALVVTAAPAAAVAAPSRRSPPPAPATSTPEETPPTAEPGVDQWLTLAAQACDALDFESCIRHGQAALGQAQVQDGQREQAYLLLGGAYAVMGQGVEADRYFRLLLRLKPEYQLPADTPPRIMGPFKRVQVEEEQLRNAVKEAQRRQLIKSLALNVHAPERHAGGQPLTLSVDVVDPMAGIDHLVLHHRMGSQGPFSSTPITGTGSRRQATFTAAQTASDSPFRLEFMVVAKDRDGVVLVQQGSPEQPLVVHVEAGQIPGAPLWQHRQFWLLAAGGGLAATVLTAGLTACAATTVALGSTAVFLVIRGDGVPATSAGKHHVDNR